MRTPAEIAQAIERLPPDQLGELAGLVVQKVAASSWPPITKLELLVTTDCNLRCSYCWVEKLPERMSLDAAESAVDFLIGESRHCSSVHITLFGGEPLLEFELIRQLVPYAERRASAAGKTLGWSLTTNGTLLEEGNILFAIEHGINYLVSLDGIKDAHDRFRVFPDGSGSFDLVVDALRRYARYQAWTGVRLTVNPETVGQLAQSVRFLREVGVKQFIIAPVNDRDWPADSMAEFRQGWEEIVAIYRKARRNHEPMRMTVFERSLDEDARERASAWGCEAGRDKIAVAPDGRIFPCSKFIDAKLDGAYQLGSVDQGITNYDARADLLDGRASVRASCLKCSEGEHCTGCCPATNLRLHGSIYLAGGAECAVTKMFNDAIRRHPDLPEISRLQMAGP